MKRQKFNRRKFLRNSSAGALGAGIFGNRGMITEIKDPNQEPPKIKGYKTLGRTGFRVSDIGVGWGLGGPNPTTLKAVLNMGVNLIETSEMYSGGNDEKSVGTVVRDFRREELFIISKIAAIIPQVIKRGQHDYR